MTGLRVTVGDEFQGTYATLGEAVEAALRVRLALLPEVDTRFGLGRGEVTVLDARRGIEDGPGWWAARAAIEEVDRGRRPRRDPAGPHRVPRGAARRGRDTGDGGRGGCRGAGAGGRRPDPSANTPSTRPCCVGTIWLARCPTARSDS